MDTPHRGFGSENQVSIGGLINSKCEIIVASSSRRRFHWIFLKKGFGDGYREPCYSLVSLPSVIVACVDASSRHSARPSFLVRIIQRSLECHHYGCDMRPILLRIAIKQTSPKLAPIEVISEQIVNTSR